VPVMLPPPVYLAGGQGGLHYVDHFFGGGGGNWPSQDTLSIRGCFALINHPFMGPARLVCAHYCNIIARILRNIRPPLDPPFVGHTPYNVGNGNIV